MQYPGKEDRALEHCDTALKLSPGNAKALYRKGMAYKALRDVDRAREWLKKCPPAPEVTDALKESVCCFACPLFLVSRSHFYRMRTCLLAVTLSHSYLSSKHLNFICILQAR